MEKILVARHLDDIDDLRTFGRDGPLAETEDNAAKLEGVTAAVYERLVENGSRSVLFVSSPRLRATQTARKIGEKIQDFSEGGVRSFYSINHDLHSTDQGNLVLPASYEPGQPFIGLQLAGKIFDDETHGSDRGLEDNIDYRFGDPVRLPNGSYKYSELLEHFMSYGETYRETLVRLFGAVLETADKYTRFQGSTEVVVVAHGQQYHLFSELATLGSLLQAGVVQYQPGASIKLMWEIYKNSDESQKVPGICAPIDFSLLADPVLVSYLRTELDFLKHGGSLND